MVPYRRIQQQTLCGIGATGCYGFPRRDPFAQLLPYRFRGIRMRVRTPGNAHGHSAKELQLLPMGSVQDGLCHATFVGTFMFGHEDSVPTQGDKPIVPGDLSDTFVA